MSFQHLHQVRGVNPLAVAVRAVCAQRRDLSRVSWGPRGSMNAISLRWLERVTREGIRELNLKKCLDVKTSCPS